jgi:hypothetical protein
MQSLPPLDFSLFSPYIRAGHRPVRPECSTWNILTLPVWVPKPIELFHVEQFDKRPKLVGTTCKELPP